MNFFVKITAFFLVFIFSVSSHAWVNHPSIFYLCDYHTYGPLPVRTQNPLTLLFVSQTLERASTLPKGHFSTSVETTFSNIFERSLPLTGTTVDMDMELVRTAFRFSYGITNHLEAGLELPFLSSSGGFLDSFVQGFHNTFGFPNGGRGLVKNGRFSYRVTRDGTTLYQVNPSTFQPSDLVLTQKLSILDETKGVPAITARTSLKLPTGSTSDGTGSGRPDFGFSLLAEKSYKRLHSYSQIGFLILGGDEQLSPIIRKGASLFSQAFEFNLFEHLSFVGQVDFVSSIFKHSAIAGLSEAAVDLTFGFTGRIPLRRVPLKSASHQIFYRASFTEDPTGSGPSVDFTTLFNVGVEY